MKKPASLRAALTEALDARHHLRQQPDRLILTITDCRAFATVAPGTGFQYQYTLELTLLDFAGDPVEVTVPLLLWLQRHQHQLLASPEAIQRGTNMTVDILADDKVDLYLSLQLTEDVRYALRPDGGHDVTFLDERLPMALESGTPLHAVWLDDVLIARCAAHPISPD